MMNIWHELVILALYLLGTFSIFSMLTRAIRKRYGDFVADDKLTRAAVFVASAMLLVAALQVTAYVFGHLSGRL